VPTAQQLRRAQRALDRAETAAAHRRVERDKLVGAALDEGKSQAQIARDLGLTRGRVGQLVARVPRAHGRA
jgi:hypothetical protein